MTDLLTLIAAKLICIWNVTSVSRSELELFLKDVLLTAVSEGRCPAGLVVLVICVGICYICGICLAERVLWWPNTMSTVGLPLCMAYRPESTPHTVFVRLSWGTV